jgi:hypothetical protein
MLALLAIFATVLPLVFADVLFTQPGPGDTVDFGTISISWTDGGGPTPLGDLAGYTIFLMVGGDGDGSDTSIAVRGPNSGST